MSPGAAQPLAEPVSGSRAGPQIAGSPGRSGAHPPVDPPRAGDPLEGAIWPASRLGEALRALAQRAGLSGGGAPERPGGPGPEVVRSEDRLTRWIEETARAQGVHAEEAESVAGDLDRLVRAAGPALLELRAQEAEADGEATDRRFLALLGSARGAAELLAPDHSVRRVPRSAVVERLRAPVTPRQAASLASVLERARIPEDRRQATTAAVVNELYSHAQVTGLWLLGPLPSAGVPEHLAWARAGWRLAGLVLLHVAQYVLWVGSWALLGRAALAGRVDGALLAAWALTLLTLVPIRALATRLEGRLGLDAGALIRQRVMTGAMRLDPEHLRGEGAGHLLGRAMECDALESMGLGGGFRVLSGTVELLAGATLAAAGLFGSLRLVIVGVIAAATAALAVRAIQVRRAWTDERLDMTHDLVERMVGHRTRLAQELPDRWHHGEDEAVERYLAVSRRLDRSQIALAVMPRVFLVLGILGLGAAFTARSAPLDELAVAMLGVLLVYSALGEVVGGLDMLSGAAIAWGRLRPLLVAAARPEEVPAAGVDEGGGVESPGGVVLEGQELSFRYRAGGPPVLRRCNVQVRRGDRILLEGPSGGGKSTLAAVLAGLREPQSGLLLLDGLDRKTLGAGRWRRRVVLVPQFHENHVVSGTLGFNLLMGRRWPPTQRDLADAEEVCRALELGPLLDRMPAGMAQPIGETGWQLSHGEKSRVFLARAILQDPEVLVMDESFASLDPETLGRALDAVTRRARTLVLIAHP